MGSFHMYGIPDVFYFFLNASNVAIQHSMYWLFSSFFLALTSVFIGVIIMGHCSGFTSTKRIRTLKKHWE